jgi:hypothetical protein
MTRSRVASMFVALLAVVAFTGIGVAQADPIAHDCGPGCHFARNGGCVVDGWERGARVWNECPAGAKPRPPCGEGYVWRSREKACMLR